MKAKTKAKAQGEVLLERDVLRVLSGLHVDITARRVKIVEQLDRPLYAKVNAALEALGGKWQSGKIKAHVFDYDPTDALESLIETGSFIDTKKAFDFFETPPELAAEVARRAIPASRARHELRILEPSAGTGMLAHAARLMCPAGSVECVEVQDSLVKGLERDGFMVIANNFLLLPIEERYDAIVMNPPFSRRQDVAHVCHALRFLKPGGRLVAIMANGITFRQDGETESLRELIESMHGSIEPLPDDSFKTSGTGVNTALVTVSK